MRRKRDLSGRRFGRLLAISPARIGRESAWVCVCDCGNQKQIRTQSLLRGESRSCGCWADALRAEASTRHGQHGSRVYAVWATMVQRCTNPNSAVFKNYGGRGISICAEWLNFENFLSDMGNPGPKETIERIDVNGGYSKANCVWASQKQQQRNRRNNKLTQASAEEMRRIYVSGEKTQYELAEIFGVCQGTVSCVVRGVTWS